MIALYIFFLTIGIYSYFTKPLRPKLSQFPSDTFSPKAKQQKEISSHADLKLNLKIIGSDSNFFSAKIEGSEAFSINQMKMSQEMDSLKLDFPAERSNDDLVIVPRDINIHKGRFEEKEKHDEKTFSDGDSNPKPNAHHHNIVEEEEDITDDEEETAEQVEAYSVWNIHPFYAIHHVRDYKLMMNMLALLYTSIIFLLTILSIAFDIQENNTTSDVGPRVTKKKY